MRLLLIPSCIGGDFQPSMLPSGQGPISVLHKDANMREPAIETGALPSVVISERILTLDVLRGSALLGVFLISVERFNSAFLSFDNG